MKKILFTPVAGPYGALNVMYDLAQDRLTKGQDIFTETGHMHCEALHFLALNLETPATVLEFPTLDELVAEVKKEEYDYVGINFTLLNIAGCTEMVDRLRRECPNTEVILGGYGTICFNTMFQGADPLSAMVEHICHGEGVKYLRGLLGEDVDRPILQPVSPLGGSDLPWINPYPKGKHAYIVSGLGCPNKCDFCSTSAYFDGEFIELADAQSMYEGVKEHLQTRPGLKGVTVFDENLYRDKKKVYEFGTKLREDPALGLDKVVFFGFGTNRDLSKYDLDELPMLGVGSIWIGVESMFSDLPKRQGRDITETFNELHRVGITTIGSWIGGWDFHDKKTIIEDLESFCELRPTRSQILPLVPIPGTELWKKNPGFLLNLPKRYFGRADGTEYEENFTTQELWEIVESGHYRLYKHAGPSVMRELRVHVNGIKFCAESKHADLREKRINYHRKAARELFPILKSAEFFAPNENVREDLKKLRSDYVAMMGEPDARDRAREAWIFQKASREKMRRLSEKQPVKTPTCRRFEYNRKDNNPAGLPYLSSYPREDEAYMEWCVASEHDNQLFEKLANALENDEEYVKKTLENMVEGAQKLGSAAMTMEKVSPFKIIGSSLTQLALDMEPDEPIR